jgi:nucleoid-associated protein YgaU
MRALHGGIEMTSDTTDPLASESKGLEQVAGDRVDGTPETAEERTIENDRRGEVRNRTGNDESMEHAEAGTYIVEEGDTLSDLAVRFYGDASAYMRIYEANCTRLDNPDVITPGMELLIPR